MLAPKISQKVRLKPCPRRDAPKAMTAARPQAKICKPFARNDPSVDVPSVSASTIWRPTITDTNANNLRDIRRGSFMNWLNRSNAQSRAVIRGIGKTYGQGFQNGKGPRGAGGCGCLIWMYRYLLQNGMGRKTG